MVVATTEDSGDAVAEHIYDVPTVPCNLTESESYVPATSATSSTPPYDTLLFIAHYCTRST